MKKVLVCGHRSFVATGLINELEKSGISYDCFSRGEENREGNIVTGDVCLAMALLRMSMIRS